MSLSGTSAPERVATRPLDFILHFHPSTHPFQQDFNRALRVLRSEALFAVFVLFVFFSGLALAWSAARARRRGFPPSPCPRANRKMSCIAPGQKCRART